MHEGTQPLDLLREEHADIERFLGILREAAVAIEMGRYVSDELKVRVVAYLQRLYDAHGRKEEAALVACVEPQNLASFRAWFRDEHEQCRAKLRLLERAARRKNNRAFAVAASECISFLRRQMRREENTMYEVVARAECSQDRSLAFAARGIAAGEYCDWSKEAGALHDLLAWEREFGTAKSA